MKLKELVQKATHWNINYTDWEKEESLFPLSSSTWYTNLLGRTSIFTRLSTVRICSNF